MKTIIDIFQSFDPPLEEQEKQILQLRFGLGVIREPPSSKRSLYHDGIPIGSNGHSFDEIGEVLGRTGERVRQIHSHALRRIRHPARFYKLLDFLKETPPSEDAVVLIRFIHPDRADLLSGKLRLQSADGELTDFTKQVVHLCYPDETAKQFSDGPTAPSSPHGKRSPHRKTPS